MEVCEMAEVRIFNPEYTPRSFFAGRDWKGGKSTMARHHRHHHHRRRRNPFGISSGVVKDAAYNAGGALAALYLAPLARQSGWLDVGATAVAAWVASFAVKFFGGASASDEILKGGLTATIIKAIHQAGFARSIGLGLYQSSYFSVPTASDAYGRTAPPLLPAPPSGRLGAYDRYRSRFATRF
jgi:hypothetical protein